MYHCRRFVRLVLLGCAITVAGVADPASDRPAAKPGQPADATVAIGRPPEVRIRKLHLVRPDLIPYPIASEIVC